MYKFTSDRAADHELIYLDSNKTDQLKAAHSSAHLDINLDGLSDLVMTTQSGLEVFKRQRQTPLFEYHNHVSWPSNVTTGATLLLHKNADLRVLKYFFL